MSDGEVVTVGEPLATEGQNTVSHDSPRLVAGKNGGTLRPFTRETSLAATRRRVEKKRAIVAAAAQDAVSRGDLTQRYGGEAWIAEITQAQMQIATTPEAGKSAVMAAAWLVDNAGMSEPRGKDADADGGVTFDDAQRELIRDLAAIARRVSAERGDAAIDAEVTPTEDG